MQELKKPWTCAESEMSAGRCCNISWCSSPFPHRSSARRNCSFVVRVTLSAGSKRRIRSLGHDPLGVEDFAMFVPLRHTVLLEKIVPFVCSCISFDSTRWDVQKLHCVTLVFNVRTAARTLKSSNSPSVCLHLRPAKDSCECLQQSGP